MGFCRLVPALARSPSAYMCHSARDHWQTLYVKIDRRMQGVAAESNLDEAVIIEGACGGSHWILGGGVGAARVDGLSYDAPGARGCLPSLPLLIAQLLV